MYTIAGEVLGALQEVFMRKPLCHLWNDAEYCHQQDIELIDSMRRQAEREESRRRLAQKCQVHEPVILSEVEKLGYDESTIMLLFVVPLIEVAWADASISQTERDHIMAIASLRGVHANTPAYYKLTSWLDHRPRGEFFEANLRLIQGILYALPGDDAKAFREALLVCCHDTAASPVHFFSWLSRVSAAKRECIEEISARLENREPELEKEKGILF